VRRQDFEASSSLDGYFGTFFYSRDPYVYFYTSDNENPTNFTALNGGDPVIVPTIGTGGIRDLSIVRGRGSDLGKYWILGTDLDISKAYETPLALQSLPRLTDVALRQHGMTQTGLDPALYSSGKATTSSFGMARGWPQWRTRRRVWFTHLMLSGIGTKVCDSGQGPILIG
jgi:hypothetical protein